MNFILNSVQEAANCLGHGKGCAVDAQGCRDHLRPGRGLQ